jgi:hypothetical protein
LREAACESDSSKQKERLIAILIPSLSHLPTLSLSLFLHHHPSSPSFITILHHHPSSSFISLAIQGLPSIPVDLTDPPTAAPCIPCLAAKLAAWDMDPAFQVVECPHANDLEHNRLYMVCILCSCDKAYLLT